MKRATHPTLALLSLIVLSVSTVRATYADDTVPPRLHMAIVGFAMADDADSRDLWLAPATETTLGRRLRYVPGVLVIPPVQSYLAARELQESDAKTPSWDQVAKAQGAHYRLSAVCIGPPHEVELRLKLTAIGDASAERAGEHTARGRYLDAVDDATRWVLAQLKTPVLSDEITKRIFQPPSQSLGTLENHARALLALRQDNWSDGVSRARRAVEYDRHYRPALALLAYLEINRRAGLPAADALLIALRAFAEEAQDQGDLASAELLRGMVCDRRGIFDVARSHMQKALEIGQSTTAPYDELAAINGLTDLYLRRPAPPGEKLSPEQLASFRTENLRQAAEWQSKADQIARQLGDTVYEMTATYRLGLLYDQLGEFDQSLQAHQRSLALAQKLGSRGNQATSWLYIAQCQQRRKQWDEANAALDKCLEFAPDAMKPVIAVARGGVARDQGDAVKALAAFEHAYELLAQGVDTANQLMCLRQIAELRYQIGRRDDALKALHAAIEIARKAHAPDESALIELLAKWEAQP